MRKFLRYVFLCAMPVGVTGCRGVLDPAGPIAAAERQILLNSTLIMAVVVVPVIVLTLAMAWWYRASNHKARYEPEWAYSGRIELVVWSIPTMVVILLGGVGWIGAHALDPQVAVRGDATPVRIQAISLDWKWLFIYPDLGIATVNQLMVPVGAPLELSLTSATVMNAFFVPQLGSQIYTMPGMTTHLNLLAARPGDFPGFSSHFSGDGFADMGFVVHAVQGAQFQSWLADAKTRGPTLDAHTYADFARPSRKVAPAVFRAVSPDLLATILAQAAPATTPGSVPH